MAKVKDTIDSINASINGNGSYLTKTEKQETPKKKNAFNKLLDLQLLIQKHSGLKELCKYNLN